MRKLYRGESAKWQIELLVEQIVASPIRGFGVDTIVRCTD